MPQISSPVKRATRRRSLMTMSEKRELVRNFVIQKKSPPSVSVAGRDPWGRFCCFLLASMSDAVTH